MSNEITNACRPVQLTPARKCVLMALADRADKDGMAYPSIAWLSEWTCFGRTAVIEALKWLESAGIVSITKAIGRNNRCAINLMRLPEFCPNQSAGRTGQVAADQSGSRTGVVPSKVDGDEADAGDQSGSRTGTSPPGLLVEEADPSVSRTGPPPGPVRRPDPHQSTSRTGTRPAPGPTRPAGGPDTPLNINKTSERQESKEPREAKTQGSLDGLESPIVAHLPLDGGELHAVRQSDVDRWRPGYPDLDIAIELKRMRIWLDLDPQRRKTKRGIEKFIVGWLGRQGKFDAAAGRAPRRTFAHTGTDKRNYEESFDGPST